MIVSYEIRIRHMTDAQKKKIEELQSLISVSNIVTINQTQYDIKDAAESFLTYYYGVSKDVSKDYRKEKLKELMTEQALKKYDIDTYDDAYGYESIIDDITIYINEETASDTKVEACIFFTENIKWPNINQISNPKYFKGEFVNEDGWKLNLITEYHQLISEEDYNSMNLNTNGESEVEDEN